MMYVALSYDHRIVDGREAVSFLVRVKELHRGPLAPAVRYLRRAQRAAVSGGRDPPAAAAIRAIIGRILRSISPALNGPTWR